MKLKSRWGLRDRTGKGVGDSRRQAARAKDRKIPGARTRTGRGPVVMELSVGCLFEGLSAEGLAAGQVRVSV